MKLLIFLRQLIPLLVFVLGLIAWGILPDILKPLTFQSKALFTFSLSLSVLSCLLLPLGPRLMESLKITTYLLFFLTFILALEPFYLTFLKEQQLYIHLKKFVSSEKALWAIFSDVQQRLIHHHTFYEVWLIVAVFPLLCILYFFHLLFLVPGRRLFLDRSYRVKVGPWVAGFLEKSKEKALLRNKRGLPLGVPTHQKGTKGSIIRYLPNPAKGWLGGHHVVISGSQGGKGVSCVLPAILDHRRVVE